MGRMTNFRSAAIATGNAINDSAYDNVKIVADIAEELVTMVTSIPILESIIGEMPYIMAVQNKLPAIENIGNLDANALNELSENLETYEMAVGLSVVLTDLKNELNALVSLEGNSANLLELNTDTTALFEARDQIVSLNNALQPTISELSLLMDSMSEVLEVQSKLAEIEVVEDNLIPIAAVATDIGKVNTVADSMGDIVAILPSLPDVGTLVANITGVNSVSTEMTNVVALGSIADKLESLSDVSSSIPVVESMKGTLEDVASEPMRTAVLGAYGHASTAETDARTATLKAWEAEAWKRTADSFATQPVNEYVRIWTSNEDGTFTATTTPEYSALHYMTNISIVASGYIIDDLAIFEHTTYSSSKVEELLALKASLDLATATTNGLMSSTDKVKIDNVPNDTNTELSTITQDIVDINLLLASDDTTLDELQEVVNFVKVNRDTIDALSLDNIVEGITNKYYTITEKNKLAGIEEGATVDQTGAEIKALYEDENDTNAYTDLEKLKLSLIDEVDLVNAPAGVLPVLDGSNLTGLVTVNDTTATLYEPYSGSKTQALHDAQDLENFLNFKF